jgi:hypothetical protein
MCKETIVAYLRIDLLSRNVAEGGDGDYAKSQAMSRPRHEPGTPRAEIWITYQ